METKAEIAAVFALFAILAIGKWIFGGRNCWQCGGSGLDHTGYGPCGKCDGGGKR
jgi:hypothetical protein